MKTFQKMKAFIEEQDKQQGHGEAKSEANFRSTQQSFPNCVKTQEKDFAGSTEMSFGDSAEEPPGSEHLKSLGSLQPGANVHYQIPLFTSLTAYRWEWHRGTIALVDEDWQMILVVPETEDQPWRWVARTYVQTISKD